jgi:hypothetical protein
VHCSAEADTFQAEAPVGTLTTRLGGHGRADAECPLEPEGVPGKPGEKVGNQSPAVVAYAGNASCRHTSRRSCAEVIEGRGDYLTTGLSTGGRGLGRLTSTTGLEHTCLRNTAWSQPWTCSP